MGFKPNFMNWLKEAQIKLKIVLESIRVPPWTSSTLNYKNRSINLTSFKILEFSIYLLVI